MISVLKKSQDRSPTYHCGRQNAQDKERPHVKVSTVFKIFAIERTFVNEEYLKKEGVWHFIEAGRQRIMRDERWRWALSQNM